jgi:arylsulfatase A-like enzyme/Flp pilus assembly protein TadD
MRNRVALSCLLLFAAVCLAIWLWPRQKHNLLLITLDTTRADRLGCYGYKAARTPVLDELARSGVICERAYTVAPLTLPAHTSLFTGLYPAETGIRTNGHGRLDDSIPTLAEILKRQGFDTAAFVASFVLDARFGLDRGFRKYDDDIAGERAGADDVHRDRPGAAVIDAALAWLGENRSAPFFCWVHLFDPHAPYLSHADQFQDEFSDRPYDGEIAYVDQQIGRLMTFLKNRGIDSRTLVVIVGDHGEGLGEHVERRHGLTLYDATMHVPLIFRDPEQLSAGRRVASSISIVDLSPTILDVLGFNDRRATTGKSMKAALLGKTAPPSPCYGATDDPFFRNGSAPLRSLLQDEWKYIRTTRAELYDLKADPGERQNLAGSEPARLQAMEARMVELEAQMVARSGSNVPLNPAQRRALESLGYVGSPQAIPAPPVAGRPDIKDLLPLEMQIEDAVDLFEEGKTDAAIDELQRIAPLAPGHAKAHWYLAAALRKLARPAESHAVLQRLLDVKPDAVEGHYGLALALVDENRLDEAQAEFNRTLQLDPDFAEAHYDLAMIDVRRGNAESALSHFGAVLEIDHCHGAAYVERGTLLVTQGRIAEALADFRSALKYSPRSPTLHHNLGLVLAGKGQIDDALAHLRQAIELAPQTAEFRYSFGTLLMSHRDYGAAAEQFSRALELNPDHAAARARLEEASEAKSTADGKPGS